MAIISYLLTIFFLLFCYFILCFINLSYALIKLLENCKFIVALTLKLYLEKKNN